MIDIGKILKRAWHILWNYKVLWIFGVLLALTAGGGGGGNGGGGNSGYRGSNGYNGFPTSTNPQVEQLNQWFQQNLEPLALRPADHIATFVWIGVALFLFILIVSAIVALIRFPAETAAIRMVDGYEQTGEKVGFRAGWKMGWNHRAFRMWWVDFLIQGLPVIVFLLVLIGLGVGVYFSVRNGNQNIMGIGIVAAVLCFILFTLVFGLAMAFMRLLRQFYWRKIALEDTGTRDAFRQGWDMFKRNWKSGALMWLVMFGIGIGFGIASLLIFFLLIPAYIILVLPAALVAAIPGLIAFGITSLFATPLLAVIVGVLFALPFFFLVVFAPLTLIGGWYMIYESSVWTLTFREIKVLDTVAPAAIPPLANPAQMPPLAK